MCMGTLIFSMYKELLFTRRMPCIHHHSFLKSSRKDELQSYRSVMSFIYFICVVLTIPAYCRRSTIEMLTPLLLFALIVSLRLLTQRHYITKQSFGVLFFIWWIWESISLYKVQWQNCARNLYYVYFEFIYYCENCLVFELETERTCDSQ